MYRLYFSLAAVSIYVATMAAAASQLHSLIH